ncbi:MAG: late competence development ComFB family protein [Bacillota bacterium]
MEKFNRNKLKETLHNHTEDIVLDTMTQLLYSDKYNQVCTCNQCLLDIASFALNRLPAKYVSSPEGNLHTKLDEFEQQYQVDIIKIVARAIKIVRENPSPQCKTISDNKNS